VTSEDREKYSRQVLFQPLGEAGQERLLAARAVVAGCGALGSFAAEALVRAGVGTVVVADRDYVESSNLQRQSLYDESDARQALPKAAAAEAHLRAINSGVRVEGRIMDITPSTVEELIAGSDIVLDGTDNFETRFLLNDACVKHGVAWIYAAAVGSYGVTMPVIPGRTACLACVFPALPEGPLETCDTAGILLSAVSAIASFQVISAIQVLAGLEVQPVLRSMDVWTGAVRTIHASGPAAGCSVCGERNFAHLAGEGRPVITMCGRNQVQIHEHNRPVDLIALRSRLESLGSVRANRFALQFAPAANGAATQITLFPDGRAIIKGTTDPGVARSLYARYIGN
jgi:molybdopterin/thiamine biosynthesis adenylyltransferase